MSYFQGVRRKFDRGERKASALAYEAELGFQVPLWTHNCRVYWLHSLEDFVHEYLGRTDRAGWFEVIRAGQPCKLYMDVDAPATVCATEYAAFETQLRQVVVDLLWSDHRYRAGSQLEPYVLDATTDAKFSRHYIWPVVWVNNKAAGAFVDQVKAAVDHPYAAHIDTAVYTADRNFRIWDSAKEGRANALKLVAPQSALALPEEAKLCRTLISALRADEADSPLAPHVQLVYEELGRDMPAAALGAGVFKAAVPEAWEPLVEQARAWLEQRTNYRRLTVKRMRDAEISFNVQGSSIACPRKGRVHKKNGLWFDVNVRARMMRFKCQDRECNHCEWSVTKSPSTWPWPKLEAEVKTKPRPRRPPKRQKRSGLV